MQQYEFLTEEDIKIYHANSFADEPLPWLRKEDINEGLKGAGSGAAFGTILALTVGSLSKTFHIHPRLFTGISTALGAIIGHYLQKRYFIDFTNYVKLKRLVEYEPESYELILEMMQKNAEKFQKKDPKKYKQILANLRRLEKNPPALYKNYLDAEIEREDDFDDSDLFDIRDTNGRLIKRGTSEITKSRNPYSVKYSPEYDATLISPEELDGESLIDTLQDLYGGI